MDTVPSFRSLESRYEATLRDRVASHAVKEFAKVSNAARVREAYGKESSLWAPISEPLFAALGELRGSIAHLERMVGATSGGDQHQAEGSESPLPRRGIASVSLGAAVDDVEIAIKQQMLSLFQSFERQRAALEKERDEARMAYATLREETHRFDTESSRYSTIPPITHPFASHLPQQVSITANGRIVASEHVLPSSSASSRPTTSGGAGNGLNTAVFSASDFNSTQTGKSGTLVASVLGKDGLAMQLHLLCESIASQLSAQHVRLFLFDTRRNLVPVADFPRGYDGAPTLDDSKTGHRRWGRALRAVAERNMSIVGYSLSDEELAERMGRQKKRLVGTNPSGKKTGAAFVDTGADSDGDGLPFRNSEKVRCYLCWPIRAFGAPSVVRGAIEVVNKRYTMSSPHQRSFTTDDEWVVHHAAKTISAILSRYPFTDEVLLSSRSTIPRILGSLRNSSGIPPFHVPDHPYADKPSAVVSAEGIVNLALTTQLSLPVFRGVMHSIRTNPSTVESVAAMASASTESGDACVPQHISHLPSTDTATVDFRPDAPTQLTRLDHTLESLDTMWRQEHEENRLMHEQSRYWSGRVRSLTDMTACFTEAIAKVKHMRSVEEIQTYLRTLDLSVRTSNVPTFLAAISEGASTPSSPTKGPSGVQSVAVDSGEGSDETFTCPETLAIMFKRRIEPLDEGPTNVRTFTLDPNSKRRQQDDIQRYIEEHTMLGDAIKRREQEIAAGSHYSRPTQLSSVRTVSRRPSWQIEQRHELFEEKRKRELSARVGVPPIISSPRSREVQLFKKTSDSPLVLPERALYLPAPPHSARPGKLKETTQ